MWYSLYDKIETGNPNKGSNLMYVYIICIIHIYIYKYIMYNATQICAERTSFLLKYLELYEHTVSNIKLEKQCYRSQPQSYN